MSHYDNYIRTDFAWYSTVPYHWLRTRVKYAVNEIIGGGTPKTGHDDYWLENDCGIPWVSISDISSSNGMVTHTEKRISEDALIDHRLRVLPRGTLIISVFASLGKIAVLNIDAAVNQAILGFIHSEDALSLGFLKYYFLFAERHISYYSSSNTQENLNLSKIKNLHVFLPPLTEQTAIASYLDEKTAQIDKLISDKQRLIELLKEEQAAVINEAVSGHGKNWEKKKLKYIGKVTLGKMLTNDNKGGCQLKPYLRSANIQWLNNDLSDVKEMWFSSPEMEKLRLKRFDLLVSEGGEVGRTSIWNEELPECYIQNSVHKVTFIEGMNPFFFLYKFYYLGAIGYFESIVNKISIGHLTVEKLKEVYVSYPPSECQGVIVSQIQEDLARIDKVIEKLQKEVDLFVEYRTVLISDVVTGKIKVA